MLKRYALLSLTLVCVVGCQSESKDSGSVNNAKPPASVVENGAKSDTGNAKEPGAGNAPNVAKLGDEKVIPNTGSASHPGSTKELPGSLKHEGYEYDGLANSKPVDMELVISNRPGVITGSQTATLKEVKDGKAIYAIERTGGLSVLGSDEVSVETDGVYTNSSSVAKLSSHAMELPASPKPGMTWKFHVSADQPDSKMDMETTCKVLKTEKVATKGGTYPNALLVEQDSVGSLQKKKIRTVSRSWYVKGIGTVKADLVTYRPNGTTEKLTIQEIKHQ